MPYSIVHFVETDEVEIIPINWLSASKNKCWWPPYKSSERQSKAVMNGDTPNQQVWLSFDVKVLGGGKIFGSYNQAKNNVGKALEETDPEFESDLEVTGRGQRHKKTVHLPPPGDSDSEEEPPKMKQNRSIPTKTIPPPPQYFSLVGEGLQSEKEDGHESSLPGPSDPPSPTNSQQYQGTLSSEQVLSSSHELESRSIPQAEDIDTTFGRDNGTLPNAGNLVDDESDLKKLEDFAKASRITLITELQKGIRATKDVKIATQRILAKLLTDKYASSYNWIGSRGPKSPFSKSWMKHIIYEAIQGLENLGNADDDEIWEAIKNWLKNSNKRIESDRKKLEKSNAALPLRNTGPESDN
ncbi:hypothetical protein Fcan01_00111 [Folsomia candida]|uniref:DUF4806 domain-containing protein n=1 Tax=Folsomia candida TaxID=158441 RepID=A0A226F515_FOLCA|nr:hypothetical protein Fcan01_00111 [Folsomia candida]